MAFPKHLTTLADWTPSQIGSIVRRSRQLKTTRIDSEVLRGQTLGMLFSKKSTRTRVSAEVAFSKLGGHPLFLGAQDIQLGKGESLRDTAQVIGSMVDMILARVDSHESILELCKYSEAPVINALSDTFHPLQILADLVTMSEVAYPTLGDELFKKTKVAWIGDANNVMNSLAVTLPRLGFDLTVATPQNYPMNPDVRDFAIANSKESVPEFGSFQLTHSPLDAVSQASFIITDTWISMGQESEQAKRLHDFAGFQVTEEMALKGGANPDWKFMHCLPRKSNEVDDHVFYGPRSLVFEEARNRMYSKLAVFEMFGLRHSLVHGT